MGEINIIATHAKRIDSINTLTRYINKNVFTKDGEKIGRVRDIVFDKTVIHGIMVAKFRFFKKMYVGMEYVDRFTPDSVLLRINPVILMLGKIVFDSEGKIVGRVKRVIRKNNSNAFDSIVIKKGLFSKEKTIDPKDMIILKKNIRLKIEL